MTWQRFVADYGEIVTLAAFFAAVGFVTLYTYLAPWYKSSLGRSIVALDSALALTVLPSVLHFLFGVSVLESKPFAIFALSSFTTIPLIIVWRGYLLWRIQVGVRRAEADAMSAEAERLDTDNQGTN